MFEERVKFIKEAIEEIDFKIDLKVNSYKFYNTDKPYDIEERFRLDGAIEALRELKRHFELNLKHFIKEPFAKKCRFCNEEGGEMKEVWTLDRTTAQYCMNHCHYGSDDWLHTDCALKIENFMLEEQGTDILETQLERD